MESQSHNLHIPFLVLRLIETGFQQETSLFVSTCMEVIHSEVSHLEDRNGPQLELLYVSLDQLYNGFNSQTVLEYWCLCVFSPWVILFKVLKCVLVVYLLWGLLELHYWHCLPMCKQEFCITVCFCVRPDSIRNWLDQAPKHSADKSSF